MYLTNAFSINMISEETRANGFFDNTTTESSQPVAQGVVARGGIAMKRTKVWGKIARSIIFDGGAWHAGGYNTVSNCKANRAHFFVSQPVPRQVTRCKAFDPITKENGELPLIDKLLETDVEGEVIFTERARVNYYGNYEIVRSGKWAMQALYHDYLLDIGADRFCPARAYKKSKTPDAFIAFVGEMRLACVMRVEDIPERHIEVIE